MLISVRSADLFKGLGLGQGKTSVSWLKGQRLDLEFVINCLLRDLTCLERSQEVRSIYQGFLGGSKVGGLGMELGSGSVWEGIRSNPC